MYLVVYEDTLWVPRGQGFPKLCHLPDKSPAGHLQHGPNCETLHLSMENLPKEITYTASYILDICTE